MHQKEALSHLKQWPKDEEGEPAQKKGRREEGEMTFMEPRGEIQVCACVCVCVCACVDDAAAWCSLHVVTN